MSTTTAGARTRDNRHATGKARVQVWRRVECRVGRRPEKRQAQGPSRNRRRRTVDEAQGGRLQVSVAKAGDADGRGDREDKPAEEEEEAKEEEAEAKEWRRRSPKLRRGGGHAREAWSEWKAFKERDHGAVTRGSWCSATRCVVGAAALFVNLLRRGGPRPSASPQGASRRSTVRP
ncbi:Protein of unknown function [Gryllus bimaculatus]|nr:Protein of unknown function [Gryllus bimaculatus]